MNIREIEGQLGIPRANVRYYEKEGLLHPRRSANNYRDYTDEDVETLKKIRLLRQLEMPVETIRAVQAGEVPLACALARQERLLENEAAKLDQARAVCRSMLSDGAAYPTLDPARYERAVPALSGGPSAPQDAPERPPVEGAAWAFDPWQRFWARTFDLALAGAAAWALLTLGFHMNLVRTPRLLLQAVSLFFSWALLLAAEPLLLRTWGTTPGKRLLGLELRNKQGEKLTFLQGLRRTWGVLYVGYGVEIPFFRLYCLYKACKSCREDKPLSYDSENLYYSKRPGQWGLRAAAAAVLMLGLIPVRLGCAFQSILPPNRGEVTPAAFAENVSAVSEALGYPLWVNEGGFRLSTQTVKVLADRDEDDWQERRYGEPYEDKPVYTLETDENGYVTAVCMEWEEETSGGDLDWVWLPTDTAYVVLAAFRGGWCGSGYDMLNNPMMATLGQDPGSWDGTPIREDGFALTVTLEQEGYMTGGEGILFPCDGVQTVRYRFALRLERTE